MFVCNLQLSKLLLGILYSGLGLGLLRCFNIEKYMFVCELQLSKLLLGILYFGKVCYVMLIWSN